MPPDHEGDTAEGEGELAGDAGTAKAGTNPEPSADGAATFSPIRKLRAFEEIIVQLQDMIVRGELRPGDHLPNERSLSEMLGVSRPSLREALRVLEGLEIIVVRTGVGAASGSVINQEAGGALSKVLRLHLALGHFTADELIEIRRVLESWSVRTAAAHRTDQQLGEMESLVQAMEARRDDPARYLELDAQFHVAIATAAGNMLLTRLMEALRDPIVHQIIDLTAWADWRDVVARATADHRRLLEAIAARDADEAETAMRHHLAFYDERPAMKR
jgi:GntR family transcriptional repressor for pyruvate dehydrogenase complex